MPSPIHFGPRAGLLLLLVFWAVLLQAAPEKQSPLGKPAPVFVRGDLNGKRLSLRSFRGRIVLLNFWATWCAPCQAELPRFSAWQSEYGPGGLQVIAVSMDDDEAPVRALVRRFRLNFPVVMGDQKLGRKYGGILGLPVTFLIGRDGTILARFGSETDLHGMESQLKKILASH